MKIIHCADLHLDSPFSELDVSKAEIRRNDIREAFGKIIALCKDEQADALIISGDLFDSKRISKLTVDFIISKFAEIPNIPVFIAAGNHDPKTPRSYYNLTEWGKNVHIFDTTLEKTEVCGTIIAGISFGSDALSEKPLLTEENFKTENKPTVLVMHANLGGKDYNPVSKSFIQNSGITYFAAGHVHKNYKEKIGNTLFCYPGCPEGRGFDETGEKGVYIVNIENGEAKAEFFPISKRKYIESTVDVTNLTSFEAVIGKIITETSFSSENLYKITLKGEAEFNVDVNVLKDSLKCFYVKIYNKTMPKTDLSLLKNDYSVQGLFVSKMLERMQKEGETEELKRALSFGLAAIRGEKVTF